MNKEIITWKGKALDACIYRSSSGQGDYGVSLWLNLDGFTWMGNSYDDKKMFYHPSKQQAVEIAFSQLEKEIEYHAIGTHVESYELLVQQTINARNKAIEQQKFSKSLQKMLNLGV